MRAIFTLLSAIGLALVITTGAQALTISPQEAPQHYGDNVTVQGVVAQVSQSGKGTVFINFGGHFPNHIFYAVIFNNLTHKFSGVQNLTGRTVAISGEIGQYDGKPQIILYSPSQIEVLN